MGSLEGVGSFNFAGGNVRIRAGSVITTDLADGCVTIDKMKDRKNLVTMIFNVKDIVIGLGVFGFVVPYDMQLVEASMYMQTKGTVGQTEIDVKLNGSTIFPTGPMYIRFDEAQFKIIDLKSSPIQFVNNAEVTFDITNKATDAEGVTFVLTFKTDHIS